MLTRRAGRATRAAGPPDRSALRLPAGHRVVPGRRRLPVRPEPADHHGVPHPGARRRGEPRLRVGRSPADDDRPHEAAGARHVEADVARTDARGRREAVRRRDTAPGVAGEAGRSPGGHGTRRSADPGRAADRARPWRLHPDGHRRCPRRTTPGRPALLDRHRSRHRHRPHRTRPGIHRRLAARHPHEVGVGAVRLHPGGPARDAAGHVRSAEPAGDHGGDGGHLVAQRSPAGLAGREERGRHAHPVRAEQRDVADGTGAPGRRRRDPSPSGRGGLPAGRG